MPRKKHQDPEKAKRIKKFKKMYEKGTLGNWCTELLKTHPPLHTNDLDIKMKVLRRVERTEQKEKDG